MIKTKEMASSGLKFLSNMDDFFRFLSGKSIHIVGVTGAEGSSILRLLCKHGIFDITAHDFLIENSIEKSYKIWHKGISTSQRNKYFHQFEKDLGNIVFYKDRNYLKNIDSADIIFVPQSWRLYKDKNLPLWKAKEQNIPFYSLTKLYLDFSPAQIVAVTGTVGKGSVAHILVQLLRNYGRRVYFAGNETWMVQLAEKIDEMEKQDIFVLEISHRQLQDGFSRAPHIVVFTNIYPNHLDELSWRKYQDLKLSLLKSQTEEDLSILNFDIPQLTQIATKLKSKVLFFSAKNNLMNTKNVQKIYNTIMSNKYIHYPDNLLCVSTVLDSLNIDPESIIGKLPNLTTLPARLENIGDISGMNFYDDIKSTTPWSTLAAVERLAPNVILVCGGRTKRINYKSFSYKIKGLVKFVFILNSELSGHLTKLLPKHLYQVVPNLRLAIQKAYQMGDKGDHIVISPAAAFFYTDFIKRKLSVRKLITSLPPKEPIEKDPS